MLLPKPGSGAGLVAIGGRTVGRVLAGSAGRVAAVGPTGRVIGAVGFAPVPIPKDGRDPPTVGVKGFVAGKAGRADAFPTDGRGPVEGATLGLGVLAPGR
jgi:hypothetical protein